MSAGTGIVLFLLGAALGSFMNVVAFRYDETQGLFRVRSLKGRSACMACRMPLRWFELIPIFSFFLQGAKCRRCLAKLSWQYPAVELCAGLLFAFLPQIVGGVRLGIWLVAGLLLLLAAAVDARLRIIPDELNVLLAVLGVLQIMFLGFASPSQSFLTHYALLPIFSWAEPFAVSQFAGAVFGAAVYGLIIVLTKGRAMGMGDLKLSAATGFLLGFPDVLIATMLAFIAGGAVSAGLMIAKRKTMKDMIPFGPFIVAGVALVVFFGTGIMKGYFQFFEWLLGP